MDRPGRSMSGYAVLVGGFVLLLVAVYLGWVSKVRPRSHTERAMRRMRIMTEAA